MAIGSGHLFVCDMPFVSSIRLDWWNSKPVGVEPPRPCGMVPGAIAGNAWQCALTAWGGVLPPRSRGKRANNACAYGAHRAISKLCTRLPCSCVHIEENAMRLWITAATNDHHGRSAIDCHRPLMTATVCHWLPLATVDFHGSQLTAIDSHWVPATAAYYH